MEFLKHLSLHMLHKILLLSMFDQLHTLNSSSLSETETWTIQAILSLL